MNFNVGALASFHDLFGDPLLLLSLNYDLSDVGKISKKSDMTNIKGSHLPGM